MNCCQEGDGQLPALFDLIGYRVIVEKRGGDPEAITEATLKLRVDGEEMLTVAEGDGPVNALDSALRKALTQHYPELAAIRLTDFKVRVINVKEGTAAKVRTIVDSADAEDTGAPSASPPTSSTRAGTPSWTASNTACSVRQNACDKGRGGAAGHPSRRRRWKRAHRHGCLPPPGRRPGPLGTKQLLAESVKLVREEALPAPPQ